MNPIKLKTIGPVLFAISALLAPSLAIAQPPLPPAHSVTRIERPEVSVVRNQAPQVVFDIELVEKEIRTDISYVNELVSIPYNVQIPYNVLVTYYRTVYRCYGPYPQYCRYERYPYQVWETRYRTEVRYRQEWRPREIRSDTLVRSETVPARVELVGAVSNLGAYGSERFTFQFSGALNSPQVVLQANSITNDYRVLSQNWVDQKFLISVQGTQVTTFDELADVNRVQAPQVMGENGDAVIEFSDSTPVRNDVNSSYLVKVYGKKRGKFKLLGSRNFSRNEIVGNGTNMVVPVKRLQGLTRREIRRYLDEQDEVRVTIDVQRESPLWLGYNGVLAQFNRSGGGLH